MKKTSFIVNSLLALSLLGAGCGSTGATPRTTDDLSGTQWSLARFNGTSTTQGEYIAFDTSDKFRGKFCNNLNGSYMIANDRLTSTNTIMTMMACMDNRMTEESSFSKGLLEGFKLEFDDQDRLVLTASDGSVFTFVPSSTPNVIAPNSPSATY